VACTQSAVRSRVGPGYLVRSRSRGFKEAASRGAEEGRRSPRAGDHEGTRLREAEACCTAPRAAVCRGQRGTCRGQGAAGRRAAVRGRWGACRGHRRTGAACSHAGGEGAAAGGQGAGAVPERLLFLSALIFCLMGLFLGPKLKNYFYNFWATTRTMALLALGVGPPLGCGRHACRSAGSFPLPAHQASV
jgi:hypothetical protein